MFFALLISLIWASALWSNK